MRVSLMTQRNRAAFSRSASRHSLHVCEPIIITLAWERLHNHLKPRENIYSHVPRSSLGALWGKWADKPLYGCHMQYKDLIRSPVSKYNDGFWENSVCKDWWELRWWHREACRPVSSSRCGSNQRWPNGELFTAALTRTHTLADTTLQHHFSHPLSPSTSYSTCGVCAWDLQHTHRLSHSRFKFGCCMTHDHLKITLWYAEERQCFSTEPAGPETTVGMNW